MTKFPLSSNIPFGVRKKSYGLSDWGGGETIGHRPKLFATKFRYDICRQLLGGRKGERRREIFDFEFFDRKLLSSLLFVINDPRIIKFSWIIIEFHDEQSSHRWWDKYEETLGKDFSKVHQCTETPLGLANCWECVFSSPPRGRQNGSTKLIPLLRWRGLAAPLFLTRNLVNSANFSIRFQDFQAEKGARKGDRSFFDLVTPSWIGEGGGWDYPAELTFILENSAGPPPREKILSRIPRFSSLEKFHHQFFRIFFPSPRSNLFLRWKSRN